MIVTLVPFEERHSIATLKWNNDPELARWLGRPGGIGADEHARWFAALASRTDTLFRAIHTDAGHVGNVWLADIDTRHRKAEVRILIGEKSVHGSGVGWRALDAMAQYAFTTLALHRVYAYVLAFNPRARRAFEKAGFMLEGTLRDDRRDGEAYVDAHLLGRLSESAR
jgi:RimJ/RimL family protein N-acetyltransferase